jgi:hypothetical protein
MPRTCKEDNCNNSVFWGDYCRYHQYRRSMKGGDKYNADKKPNKPPKPRSETRSLKSNTIHRRTPKRALDERYYAVQAKEFFDKSVFDSTNKCHFCGERVLTFQGLHHTEGRDGSRINDFTKIVIVHNDCHLFYHRATLQQLMEQKWFVAWMGRLKSVSTEAYNKELRKAEKTINLFGDEENI